MATTTWVPQGLRSTDSTVPVGAAAQGFGRDAVAIPSSLEPQLWAQACPSPSKWRSWTTLTAPITEVSALPAGTSRTAVLSLLQPTLESLASRLCARRPFNYAGLAWYDYSTNSNAGSRVARFRRCGRTTNLTCVSIPFRQKPIPRQNHHNENGYILSFCDLTSVPRGRSVTFTTSP